MKGDKRNRAAFGAFLLLAIVGGAVWALWLGARRERPRPLLARAHCVLGIELQVPPPSAGAAPQPFEEPHTFIEPFPSDLEKGGYNWQTSDTLLTWRLDDTTNKYRLVRVHAATGASDSLPAFNRRAGLRDEIDSEWRVSPDGRWIVWANNKEDEHGYKQRISWTLAALDGSHVESLPAGPAPSGLPVVASDPPLSDNPFGWHSDSRGWTVLTSDAPSLRVRSYNRPAAPAVRPGYQDVLIGSALGNPATLPAPHPREMLGFAPDGRAVGASWSERGVNVWLFGVHVLPNDVRRFKVRLPPGAIVDGAALSPNGERVAWALYRFEARPEWIDRLLFWIPRRRPGAHLGLYVTNRDGTQGHLIGWMGAPLRNPNLPPDFYTTLAFLRWTPDGQRISFVHENALYVLPVPDHD